MPLLSPPAAGVLEASLARSLVEETLTRVEAAVRADPVLAALATAALVLAVVVLALLLRWRRRPMGDRFRRVLVVPDRLVVLTHPNPDPDAMAAALGVAHLAESVGTPARIQHPGEIRHQENRAFRTVLDMEIDRLGADDHLAEGAVVLVDHNEARGFRGAEAVEPYAVIDHHPGDGTGTAFADVRPDYGACSTIIAEYFRELGAKPVEPGESAENGLVLPSRIATGLLYGILSDTSNLTRGPSAAEFAASAYLYPGVDEDRLDRIANPEVDAEVLNVIAAAIDRREVRGPFVVSDVGELSNADAIPQAADVLLGLEGVTAVVVYGERDGTIHLSGRSRDDRVHMGNTLQVAVGDIAQSSAGGHARMGGGQVSVTHMEGLRPESGITRQELTNRLFAAMSGER